MTAPVFLRALADLLEQHQATLGYSTYDRGVEIDVAGVEVAAIWCNDTASGVAELRAAADRFSNPFLNGTLDAVAGTGAKVGAAIDAHLASVERRWPAR